MTTPNESRPGAPAQDFAPYLAEASEMLASSLDYQATLKSLAHLAVPRLADWCAIDMLEEDGSINQLALTHEDPDKVAWAQELRRRFGGELHHALGGGLDGPAQLVGSGVLEEVADGTRLQRPRHRGVLQDTG